MEFERDLDADALVKAGQAVDLADSAGLCHVLLEVEVRFVIDGVNIFSEKMGGVFTTPALGLAFLGSRALDEFTSVDTVSFLVPGAGWIALERLPDGMVRLTCAPMANAPRVVNEVDLRSAWADFSKEVSEWVIETFPRVTGNASQPGDVFWTWVVSNSQGSS